MKYKVFITTNHKQLLSALVSRYTIKRYSKNCHRFEINILLSEEINALKNIYGRKILKDGKHEFYDFNDLQSFTLARFMPPELMEYEGRAVVIDPDIFAAYSDIWELLNRDMHDKAILMKRHTQNQWATSVMLLDNEKLKHWSISEIVKKLVSHEIDYRDQMALTQEVASIGLLEDEWNSYDFLGKNTKLLHNTNRLTQPWKTGMRIQYKQKKMKPLFNVIPREWVHALIGRNFKHHRLHPDKKQENFFFSHLKAAIEENEISWEMVKNEIKKNHIRFDSIKLINKIKKP